jgi:hypothetical protein
MTKRQLNIILSNIAILEALSPIIAAGGGAEGKR